MAPREPPVHALLGQVCLNLGKQKEAMRHLDTAVMLDSKEAIALKTALAQVAEEDPNAFQVDEDEDPEETDIMREFE
eukprot:CAMPEP_0182424502 /NCGR_PEP_ID=MMETSP1167-20130531/10715_1 /TAXON_ID=2988 /ORGANISM="Mallomonas Sp, Strain CCMP3275" /LENGTH=76 /DNA_ID=CAMNT_0024604363 /DNA_START=721 /DNA_END=951 /DNA_ORIENTATION=-